MSLISSAYRHLINIISMLMIVNSFKTLTSHRATHSRCRSYLSSSALPIITPVVVKPHDKKISHKSKVFFIGSCFSEVVSREMRLRKFDINSNPRGIVFNPVSVGDTIEDCVKERVFTKDDLFQDNNEMNLFHSWDHHSVYSSMNSSEMLSQMNESQCRSRSFLGQCDFILITLGSAFIHKLTSNGRVVANCHKREY
jgi:GSCFA family